MEGRNNDNSKQKSVSAKGSRELWTRGLGADAEHDQTTPRDIIHFMRSCRFMLWKKKKKKLSAILP